MNNRLTEKWTHTLEEAYGSSGKKGREGEVFVMNAVRRWKGFSVRDAEHSYQDQVRGIDFYLIKDTWKNWYSVDVKNNMNDDGSFFVEIDPKGWLFHPKKESHRIWHVNTKTGQMCWYDRWEMRRFMNNFVGQTDLVRITREDKVPFITWRKL